MKQKHFQYYETLRVFLACPGDLVAERSRFPQIIELVNTLRAHSMGFHLEAIGWERVVPSFGRPQELINGELRTADLTAVIFWNKIGSPSDHNPDITGTLEEFQIALQRYGEADAFGAENNRPMMFVYFRDQTEPETESAAKVREFRKSLEDSKKLLYRQYSLEAEWEKLFTEHLVAFLNGRKRTDLEAAVHRITPIGRVMNGHFYWQSLYESGVLKIAFDFDGDDNEETVRFKFQQTRHWLLFLKNNQAYEIDMSERFVECLNESRRIHLGIKDVTNDGIAELLIAATGSSASAMLGVYGMKEGTFSEIALLPGQFIFHVFEKGHITAPYGSVGLFSDYRWHNGEFVFDDLHAPL